MGKRRTESRKTEENQQKTLTKRKTGQRTNIKHPILTPVLWKAGWLTTTTGAGSYDKWLACSAIVSGFSCFIAIFFIAHMSVHYKGRYFVFARSIGRDN